MAIELPRTTGQGCGITYYNFQHSNDVGIAEVKIEHSGFAWFQTEGMQNVVKAEILHYNMTDWC
uniref:Uncharacterized protein n=1 Tax=Romanomermis culicivorax TaxID=13658 RepID=A0A915HGE5_ROMCU